MDTLDKRIGVRLIYAAERDGTGIGLEGRLPWGRHEADLRWFREQTSSGRGAIAMRWGTSTRAGALSRWRAMSPTPGEMALDGGAELVHVYRPTEL